MTLRYILGRPGSGKTALCASEIIKAQARENETGRDLVYVVPEQFSLSAERILLAASGFKGLGGAQVLSFNRLAYRVFRETGRNGLAPLDDTGKSLLIRRALTELEGELRFFKSRRTLKAPGFVQKLSALITEFSTYGVTPDGLFKTACEADNLTQAQRLRIQDFAAVFGRYSEYIEAGYISVDRTLDVLAEKIPRSGMLTGAHIWIDGFKSFTPQELSVVAALSRVCGSITAAFTLDAGAGIDKAFGGVFHNIEEYDPFAEVKHTVNRLTAIIKDNNGMIGEHQILRETRRFVGFPELNFLINHYFEPSPPQYSGTSPGMFINACQGADEEAEACARQIAELTRRGYRYSEIGLVTTDAGLYAPRLKRVFKRYNIPLFIDERRSLLNHPLTELCRSSLAVISGGMTYENVFRALKTGLTRVEAAESDILENYVLRFGITGSVWDTEWTYGFDNLTGEGREEQIELLNALRKGVLDVFNVLRTQIKRGRKYPASELCGALYAFISASGCRERLAGWIEQSQDPERAGEHRQMWTRFCEILDKIVQIIGGERITAAELAGLLDAGFESESLRVAPPTLDHAAAGDIGRSRLNEVRVLFILGMNEGLLPSPPVSHSVMPEGDRERLREKGVKLAPPLDRKALEERLNIYQILAKPTERLYISYSSGNGENPSAVIGRIRDIIPGIKPANLPQITLAEPMIPVLFGALRALPQGAELDPAMKDVYGILLDDGRFAGPIGRGGADKAAMPPSLGDAEIGFLYGTGGRKVRSSVTRLENYAACPFMYFSRYNLKLRERKLHDIENYDVGNILHSIMERYTKNMLLGNTEESVADIAQAAASENISKALLKSRQYAYMTERLTDAAARSIEAMTTQLEQSDFRILEAELAFEGANAYTAALEDGSSAELTGRVDRVDGYDRGGKRYIRVIDYKSGMRRFSFSEVLYGLQLQLAVYLAAYLKAHPGSEPAAVLYFTVANHMIGYKKGMSPETINDEIFGEYRMSGAVSAELDIIKAMDRGLAGRSRIIPVNLTGGGTEVSGASAVLDADGFKSLIRAAEAAIRETAGRILRGEIAPAPLYKDGKLACERCECHPLCGRDARAGSRKAWRRQLPKIGEREALEEILRRNR